MSTDTATATPPKAPRVPFLKMPLLIIASGCIIGAIAFGPRSSLGLFMQPMIGDFGWGREAFAFAFALQNLIWGVAQPVAGALADRYGTPVVLAGGAVLYALGLVAMTQAGTPLLLVLTIGILMGFWPRWRVIQSGGDGAWQDHAIICKPQLWARRRRRDRSDSFCSRPPASR